MTTPRCPPVSAPAVWASCLAALLLCGCASVTSDRFPAGTPLSQVQASLGAPTGQWSGPAGPVLEYATGPAGRTTHLFQFDAAGRLQSFEQVLTEARFATIVPGMSAQALRETLGRPSQTWRIHWQDQTVWAYRYEALICRWFLVGLNDDQRVKDSAFASDPECEVFNDGGTYSLMSNPLARWSRG